MLREIALRRQADPDGAGGARGGVEQRPVTGVEAVERPAEDGGAAAGGGSRH
jgi:hypothetical protein